MEVMEYHTHFRAGTRTPVTGLAGRIIRGKKPSDFETLTDDPSRRIVMLLGPDGLEKLLGKSGHEMLVTIGYEPSYLEHKVKEGNQFKLVVLPEGNAARLATWENVLDMVIEVYPEIRARFDIHRHLDVLRELSFADFEPYADSTFLEVEKAGKSDLRFMTLERFLKSNGTTVDLRAFLYFSVHLRELFRGDGYTDENGRRGPMEYIAPNSRLSDLGITELLDVEVILPSAAPAVHIGGKIMTDVLGFLDETRAHERYTPNLKLARETGLLTRQREGLRPASRDVKNGNSRLAVIIDAEEDFDDVGRLPVKGTQDDMWRMVQRLYRGVLEEQYTDIIVTIDMHPPITVHSAAWWVDEQGKHVDATLPVLMVLDAPDAKFPFLATFIDGREKKRFRPKFQAEFTTRKYAPHLLATGQGPIWVFADHCHIGTDGTNLVSPLVEFLEFISAARDIQPTYMFKGMIPQVDWFGPFRPCMDVPEHPQGGLQTTYLDRIRGNNAIDFFGEAEDFCVKNGMKQVLEYYGGEPDVLSRINFVGDCTSPIVADSAGNTGNADFRALMVSKGVQIITAETPF